jgi:PGM1 C-terminal domain
LGIPVADGTPLVHDLRELAASLARMASDGHRRFVLKLDSTTYAGGMGNAMLDLDGVGSTGLVTAIAEQLSAARPVDPQFRWSEFVAAIPEAGVLAEEWLVGDEVRSPSFQGRLTATGPQPVSTHEQVLAADQQTYTGCSFPASERYRATLIEYGLRVGRALHELGADRGDYGVDFIIVRRAQTWQVYACELNLRATGTRHCFDIVRGLLDTTPDPDGELRVAGQRRTYVATDNLTAPHYVALSPRTLIAAVERSPLHYDQARHRGVVLHLLSALPESGKFGAVCVAESTAAATRLMDELRELADDLARQRPALVDATTRPPGST